VETFEKILVAVAAVLGVAALVGLLLGGPVWLLWNALLPDLFGWPRLSFFQALGLVVLSHLFFPSSSLIKRND
jgi:hypothetical protein